MLRRLLKRMAEMCDEAYFVVRSSVVLTAVLLSCCLLIMLAAGRLSTDTYKLYRLAEEMFRIPQAVLFVAAIGSVILEEHITKDS